MNQPTPIPRQRINDDDLYVYDVATGRVVTQTSDRAARGWAKEGQAVVSGLQAKLRGIALLA